MSFSSDIYETFSEQTLALLVLHEPNKENTDVKAGVDQGKAKGLNLTKNKKGKKQQKL